MNSLFIKIRTKYNSLSIVAKATIWFTFSNILQKSLSIITTPIFSRMLTTGEYGKVNAFNSWMQVLTIIITFRLDYGVFFKGLSKYKGEEKEYKASMQFFAANVALIVTALYLIFRNKINEITGLSTPLILIMIIEVLFTSSISFWNCEQRYYFKYTKPAILSVVIAICNVLFSIVAIIAYNRRDIARIIAVALSESIFGLYLFISNIRGTKTKNVFKYLKFALIFNIPLLPHYFSSYILEQSDRVMIQKMIGFSETGIYSMAYNIGMLMKIVSNGINNALIPLEYSLLDGKKFKELNRYVNSYSLIIFVLSVIAMILAPEIIMILAGDKYSDAIICVPPVVASCFFIFLWGIYGNAEIYYDTNRITLYISVAAAVLNLLLNYFGIKIYGYVAPAYTTLICYIVFTLAHFAFISNYTKKKHGEHVFEARILLVLGIILTVISAIVVYIYPYKVERFILLLVASIVLFLYRKKIYVLFKNMKSLK